MMWVNLENSSNSDLHPGLITTSEQSECQANVAAIMRGTREDCNGLILNFDGLILEEKK